ncbi:MAG TPA: hypothetical protein VM121_10265 [Acidimicrobiales bacterium]|nr:hypothetical protein [Acidimicrobiales bacterium]
MDPSDEEDDASPDERAELRPIERWRRNTATGAITAALALGFQQVFDPEKKDTIGIEQEAPTRPVDPDTFELHFDPVSSRATSVVVRSPRPADAPERSDDTNQNEEAQPEA